MLEELLRRRRRRVASGSPGESPLARARMLSTSVKLTTPLRRPLMPAPGSWLADTLVTPGLTLIGKEGVLGVATVSRLEPDRTGRGDECAFGLDMLKGGTWCAMPGLGGTLVDGEGASTIHMRWERVAQSLATACASVLKRVT